MRTERLWKIAALAATSMTVGVLIVATPAGAHVADWAHNWTEHIRPRTDARYYTKTQSNGRYYTKTQSNGRYYTKGQADGQYQRKVAGSGQTQSGTFAASAGTGSYGSAAIEFRPTLPADIPVANAHRQAPGTTSSNCPGIGQAAPGHLCVYEAWNNGMPTFIAFHDPMSSSAAVRTTGTVLIWSSTTVAGNVRGTWTVTAPTAAMASAGAQAVECVDPATTDCSS
jgi:hypothetical protein